MLKISQAAKFLGISNDTLRRWEKAGKIQSVRTPKGYRVYDLNYLQSFKEGTAPKLELEDLKTNLKPAQAPLRYSKPIERENTLEKLLSTDGLTQKAYPITPPSPPKKALIKPDFKSISFNKLSAGLVGLSMLTLVVSAKALPGFISKHNNNNQLAAISPSSEKLGQVLGASTHPEVVLDLNTDTNIVGDLKVSGDASVSGTLTAGAIIAPNLLNSITAGNNVTITGAANSPTISVNVPASSSLNGIVGSATLKAGGGISITTSASTLTVSNSASLSDVRSTGGCSSCITSSDIGSVSASAITGTLGIGNGGTGLTSLGTANQVLGVNSTTGALEYKTLTAGSNISISNASGSVTISATGGLSGSGTLNSLPKFTPNGTSLGNSSVSDNGSTLSISEDTSITGTLTATQADLSRAGNPSLVNGQIYYDSTAGKFKIVEDVLGTPTAKIICNTTDTGCGAGGGGVSTLDGLNGALTLANSTGNATTVTIDDASIFQKGIAKFNSTNFSGTGTINTIQDIATTSSPSFSSLSLSSNLSVTGSGTFGGNLVSTGNSTVGGTLGVTGSSSFANNISQSFGNFTQSGSGSFSTGTGSVALNGLTTTVSSLSSTGVVHTNGVGLLSSSLIVNADVSNSAAIAYSKLNLTGSIQNGDLVNSLINLSYGTGISGSASVSLGGTLTISNQGVTSLSGGTDTSVSSGTGAVTVNNTSTLSSVTNRGASTNSTISLAGGLAITGTGSFDQSSSTGYFSTGSGNVSLNGNTSVTGSKTFTVGTGATTLGGTLGVTGDSTFTGTGTFSSNLIVSGNTNLGSALAVTGAATLSSTLGVTGAATFSNNATFNNNITQTGSGSFSTGTGAVALNGLTTTVASLSSTGVVHTNGVGLLSSSLVVNADISNSAAIAYSKLNLAGAIQNSDLVNSSINLSYGTGISGSSTVSLGGTLTISNQGVTSAVAGTDISVSSGTGAITINNNSTLATVASRGSTTTNTLALNGGVSITGTGSFDQSSSTGFFKTGSGLVSLNGDTSVTGSKNFTVGTGATTLGGTLSVAGGSTFNNSIALAFGNFTQSGTGTFSTGSGTGTFNGNLVANGSVTFSNITSASGTGALHTNSLGVISNSLITNSDLANSSITINTSGPISGGSSVGLGGSITISCPTCLTNASSVSSLNSGTGSLTLSNASLASGTGLITINDASIFQKGIAQFNSTNFTGTGTINTIQDIATSSSPTFSGLSLSSNLSVTGSGTFGGNIAATGNGSIGGILNVTGATTLTGAITANNTATFNNNISQSGSGSFSTGTGAVALNGLTTTVASLSSTGVVHTNGVGLLSSSLVVNADISNSAAIAYSKLNLAGAIQNSDLVNSSINLSYGTGISGSSTVSLGGTLTINNVGVTSNVAGTDISVSSGTGAVTINNTSTLSSVTGRGAITSTTLALNGGITSNFGNFDLSSSTGTFSTGSGTGTLNGNTVVTGSKTFTVGTGATTLGGTLGVTGATTLSSTLGVSGDSTFTGTGTFNSNLIVSSGSTTLGGTLGVTGATTLSSTLGVTGASTFNNDITQSFGNFLQSGTGTFTTGSGTGTLNGNVVISGSKTLSLGGAFTSTDNGASSTPAALFAGTWFSGGGATNTKPQLLIEPSGTLSNNWSGTGTALGINAASGFKGNLIDAQVAAIDMFRVDNSGNVIIAGGLTSGSNSGQTLTLTPLTDTTALTLVGTNVTTQNLAYFNAKNAQGTIFNIGYGASQTLTGALIGQTIDLNNGQLTATNQNVTGELIKLPTITNTNAAGTVLLKGISVGFGSGAGINQTGTGATTWSSADFQLPALTQTAGTLTANGVLVTTPSSITTGGTANGLNISASGVGAGTLNGVNIGSITGGAGTETALSVGSGWDNVLSVGGTTIINGSGVTQVAGGGTGQSSYTNGDILYYDSGTSTTSLTKLAGGSGNNGKILTISGGLPVWASSVGGGVCSDCILNDPTSSTSQTIAPTGAATSSLIVKQTSTALGGNTQDIFAVCASANCTGANKYFSVDYQGNVSSGSISNTTLTLTPTSDTTALTLVGTNVPTASLQYINSKNSQGSILNIAYGAAQTLSTSTALTGINEDLSTNVTATNASVAGHTITLPAATNTNTGGTTKNLQGLVVTGGGLNQTGTGATVYSAVDLTVPALTQTTGTLTGNGVLITTPSSITTGGVANGVNITTTGVGAGTLNGVNIGSITGGSGTETALNIGGGWDSGITIGANSNTASSVFGINVGALSGAATNNYAISLGTLGGASASNYQISAGGITAVASATNTGISLTGTGTFISGTANSSNNRGIQIGAISVGGSATNNYGIDIGAISGGTSTDTALNIGTVTGGVGASSIYGINTGTLTAVNLVTNAFQINTGSVVGAATATYGSLQTGAISGTGTVSYGLNLGANSASAATNYGINIGTFSGTGTATTGINIGAITGNSVTDTGLAIGAISGTGTTNLGISIGALSAASTSKAISTSTLSSAVSTAIDIGNLSGSSVNTGINLGTITGTGSGRGINVGNISSTGTNNVGLQLGTLTGGTATNYQVNTGTITAVASATNAQLNLGTISGTAASSSNYGIKIGAISSTGSLDTGVDIGDITGNTTTNTALNIGNITGTGTGRGINIGNISSTGISNIGINLGALSGSTTTLSAFTTSTIAGGSNVAVTGINIGALSGTGTTGSVAGVQTGAISGTGLVTYGLNLGANSSYATTNYGINIGALTGSGVTNYGLYIGGVSGGTTNYAEKINATQNGGDIINVSYGSALTATARPVGQRIDLNTNVTLSNGIGATGYALSMPALSQTDTSSTSLIGINLGAAGAVTQSSAAGTITSYGMNIQMPILTQTTGTITAYGLNVSPAAIVSGASAYGVNVGNFSGTGTVFAGLNIGTIAGASATNYGVSIGAMTGTGTNYGLKIADVSNGIKNYSLITGSGFVGINTSTPQKTFEIGGVGSTSDPGVAFMRLNNTHGTAGDEFGISFTNYTNGQASGNYAGSSAINNVLDSGGAGAGLRFLTGGSTPLDAMYIDSSQNVGIGNDSPGSKLGVTGTITAISGSTGVAKVVPVSTSAARFSGPSGGTASLALSTTDYLTIDAGGELLHSASGSPSDNGAIGLQEISSESGGGYAAWFWNNAVNSGANGIAIFAGDATTGTLVNLLNGNNSVSEGSISFNSGTTSYNTTSDLRLKTNINPTSYSLDDLMKIQVNNFTFKSDSTNTIHTGFIAQQLNTIYPEAVTHTNITSPLAPDGIYQVDYGKLTPLLVKSVQQIENQVLAIQSTYDPSHILSNMSLDSNGALITPKLSVSTLQLSGVASAKLQAVEDSLDPATLTEVGDAVNSGTDSSHVDLSTTLNTILAAEADLSNKLQVTSNKVDQLQSQVAGVASESAQLSQKVASDSDKIASISATLADHSLKLTSPDLLFASDSANISKLNVLDSLSALKINTIDATISGTLKSLGQSFLASTTIAGDLNVNGTFSVTSASDGDSLNSLTKLHIQNSPLAELVDFFGGLVKIDNKGTLLTQKISIPSTKALGATADPTIGSGVIPAGQTQVNISNNQASSNTKIFISPTTTTSQPLAATNIQSGSGFSVTLPSPASADTGFNWWIIESQ